MYYNLYSKHDLSFYNINLVLRNRKIVFIINKYSLKFCFQHELISDFYSSCTYSESISLNFPLELISPDTPTSLSYMSLSLTCAMSSIRKFSQPYFLNPSHFIFSVLSLSVLKRFSLTLKSK
jgi:hypothetical protein